MENKKSSIEKAAEQLLNFKVKQKGNFPHPVYHAKLFQKALQYLIDKKYIIKTGDASSKNLTYHVTLEGFEHVFSVKV